LVILVYLKTSALQVVHGRLFGMVQGKDNQLNLSRFMVYDTSEARRPPRWLVDRALACRPARLRSWLSPV